MSCYRIQEQLRRIKRNEQKDRYDPLGSFEGTELFKMQPEHHRHHESSSSKKNKKKKESLPLKVKVGNTNGYLNHFFTIMH